MENKEIQKTKFQCGSTPDADDFAELIDSSVGVLTDAIQLPPASSSLVNTCYKIDNTLYTCKLVGGTYQWVGTALGGGGSSNYLNLSNKPKVNNVTLSGNKTLGDLGIVAVAGYGVEQAAADDRIYILKNGVPKMLRLGDLPLGQGVCIRKNITDYANPYDFTIPYGATRACFRFSLNTLTIETEVDLEDGDYSVVAHEATDTDLLVINFSLITQGADAMRISISYGSYTRTNGFLADQDGTLDRIIFR